MGLKPHRHAELDATLVELLLGLEQPLQLAACHLAAAAQADLQPLRERLYGSLPEHRLQPALEGAHEVMERETRQAPVKP